MKLLKKILGLLLIIGIIGGVWARLDSAERSEARRGSFKENFEKIQEPIRFAVMSDIHSDWGNFRKALEKTKEEFGPSFVRLSRTSARQGFVIITGDLTTLGKKSELLEAKKILDESGLQYYVIPGNHDIWWGRQNKKDVWKEVFGDSFLSFEKDGVKFILINNGDGIGGIGGVRGVGGIQEIDWIEKETEECLKVYCLVFMHMPLNHPSSLHVMGEDNPKVASEAGKIREILIKNNAKDIFAGHLHFSSSYELGELKTSIVGSAATERNFQSPKFLEIVINKGKVTKEDIFINE